MLYNRLCVSLVAVIYLTLQLVLNTLNNVSLILIMVLYPVVPQYSIEFKESVEHTQGQLTVKLDLFSKITLDYLLG